MTKKLPKSYLHEASWISAPKTFIILGLIRLDFKYNQGPNSLIKKKRLYKKCIHSLKMKILLIYSSHHENECGGWLGLVRLGYILAYIVSDMLVGEKSPVPFGSIVPPTPTRVPPPKQPLSAIWIFSGSSVFCCNLRLQSKFKWNQTLFGIDVKFPSLQI